MNGYSLVIDISSDEERTSTSIKSLPLNMVGRISDSSTEVYRVSDPDSNSSLESPEKAPSLPKKKKFDKFSIKSPPTTNLMSDSDYYEEPDSPTKQPSPTRPALKERGNIPVLGNERVAGTVKLNDLSEPSLADIGVLYDLDLEDRNYFASLGRGRKNGSSGSLVIDNFHPDGIIKPPGCCPEEMELLEKEVREMDEEERKIRDMKAGRGRGRHQSRKYNGRPPVIIRKEIPHCHALPLSLAPRGALSRPAPGRNFTCCSGIPGFGRGQGQGRGNYH